MMDAEAEADAGLDSLPQECHFLILEFLHDAKTFASLSKVNWYRYPPPILSRGAAFLLFSGILSGISNLSFLTSLSSSFRYWHDLVQGTLTFSDNYA